MVAILTQPRTLAALMLATTAAPSLGARPRTRASVNRQDDGRRSPAPSHFSCGDYLKYEDE
ncbi:MAG: hypothetical protein HYX51_04755 [Chloroflexi bacterium]|nr:hypothetical protein [Chloroflexota bacterium]